MLSKGTAPANIKSRSYVPDFSFCFGDIGLISYVDLCKFKLSLTLMIELFSRFEQELLFGLF